MTIRYRQLFLGMTCAWVISVSNLQAADLENCQALFIPKPSAESLNPLAKDLIAERSETFLEFSEQARKLYRHFSKEIDLPNAVLKLHQTALQGIQSPDDRSYFKVTEIALDERGTYGSIPALAQINLDVSALRFRNPSEATVKKAFLFEPRIKRGGQDRTFLVYGDYNSEKDVGHRKPLSAEILVVRGDATKRYGHTQARIGYYRAFESPKNRYQAFGGSSGLIGLTQDLAAFGWIPKVNQPTALQLLYKLEQKFASVGPSYGLNQAIQEIIRQIQEQRKIRKAMGEPQKNQATFYFDDRGYARVVSKVRLPRGEILSKATSGRRYLDVQEYARVRYVVELPLPGESTMGVHFWLGDDQVRPESYRFAISPQAGAMDLSYFGDFSNEYFLLAHRQILSTLTELLKKNEELVKTNP